MKDKNNKKITTILYNLSKYQIQTWVTATLLSAISSNITPKESKKNNNAMGYTYSYLCYSMHLARQHINYKLHTEASKYDNSNYSAHTFDFFQFFVVSNQVIVDHHLSDHFTATRTQCYNVKQDTLLYKASSARKHVFLRYIYCVIQQPATRCHVTPAQAASCGLDSAMDCQYAWLQSLLLGMTFVESRVLISRFSETRLSSSQRTIPRQCRCQELSAKYSTNTSEQQFLLSVRTA